MDNYNRDELQPPSWMEKGFLEEVLKSCEQCKDVKVTNFTISPATQKGDHFASVMFRANVEYIKNGKREEIAMIIKTMPAEDGIKLEMLKETSVFETEIGMYKEVIPKFHKILRDCGDQTVLGARMLYSSLEPHKVIVFEDITKQGYTMMNNRAANFEEMKLILEKICRWHAISFKLISEGDTSLDKFNKGILNLQSDLFYDFVETSTDSFMELLSNLPDQIYYEKFTKIKGNLLSNVTNIYKKSGNFCILNHGDFHIKNTMVKFNAADELQDIMLVDFQFCVLASVAIDVLYLLYMMTDAECRARRDEVIYLYHSKFVDALKIVGFTGTIPTLAELHIEIMKCRYLELYMVSSIFPFVCGMVSMKDINPEEILESGDARKVFYKLPCYTEELKTILPMLLHKGCFDE